MNRSYLIPIFKIQSILCEIEKILLMRLKIRLSDHDNAVIDQSLIDHLHNFDSASRDLFSTHYSNTTSERSRIK